MKKGHEPSRAEKTSAQLGLNTSTYIHYVPSTEMMYCYFEMDDLIPFALLVVMWSGTSVIFTQQKLCFLLILLTEFRLFKSTYHQEGNLKVQLFITLTLGCRVQYISGRAGGLLDAISFHHNCKIAASKIIQYFCNVSFSQPVFVMLFC